MLNMVTTMTLVTDAQCGALGAGVWRIEQKPVQTGLGNHVGEVKLPWRPRGTLEGLNQRETPLGSALWEDSSGFIIESGLIVKRWGQKAIWRMAWIGVTNAYEGQKNGCIMCLNQSVLMATLKHLKFIHSLNHQNYYKIFYQQLP